MLCDHVHNSHDHSVLQSINTTLLGLKGLTYHKQGRSDLPKHTLSQN